VTAGPVSIGPAVQLKPRKRRADMNSMTDTQDSDRDRWTPSDAERRVDAELHAAGVRIGAGRRSGDRVLRAQARVVSWNTDRATFAEMLAARDLFVELAEARGREDSIDAMCREALDRELSARAVAEQGGRS
jgi:hypothetical protein